MEDRHIYTREIMRGIADMQLYRCRRCENLITGYIDSTGKHAPRVCPCCGAGLRQDPYKAGEHVAIM